MPACGDLPKPTRMTPFCLGHWMGWHHRCLRASVLAPHFVTRWIEYWSLQKWIPRFGTFCRSVWARSSPALLRMRVLMLLRACFTFNHFFRIYIKRRRSYWVIQRSNCSIKTTWRNGDMSTISCCSRHLGRMSSTFCKRELSSIQSLQQRRQTCGSVN